MENICTLSCISCFLLINEKAIGYICISPQLYLDLLNNTGFLDWQSNHLHTRSLFLSFQVSVVLISFSCHWVIHILFICSVDSFAFSAFWLFWVMCLWILSCVWTRFQFSCKIIRSETWGHMQTLNILRNYYKGSSCQMDLSSSSWFHKRIVCC